MYIFYHIVIVTLAVAPMVCVFVCLKETLIKRILYSLNALLLAFAVPLIINSLFYTLTSDETGSGGIQLDFFGTAFVYILVFCGVLVYVKKKNN